MAKIHKFFVFKQNSVIMRWDKSEVLVMIHYLVQSYTDF